MKIIVAGVGKVGTSIAKQLSAEGYDLTLIDTNQTLLNDLVERYDAIGVQGNCASMPTLLEAGVMEADLLIASTSADELNLLCCMTAQGINKNLQTIGRIRNHEYTDQVYGMIDVFALSLVVNPEKQAAREIERLIRFPGFFRRETFAKGRVEIAELRIDKNSRLCDVSLMDFNSILKTKVLVCAVVRNGEAIIPHGMFVLKAGDRVFTTGSTEALSSLLKNLGIITRKVRRILLCGGGRVSRYFAQAMAKTDVSISIIEQNRQRCEELAEILPNAHIILGDASSQSVLQKQHLDECDALISCTGMDELNMIISMMAKSQGVPHVITKLSRLETGAMIFDSLDVGSVVCPKEQCCSTVVRYVRAMENQAGAAVSVHPIADGKAEALEFIVDSDTLHRGEPLKDITLRQNTIIAAITRGSKTELPQGHSTFQTGDVVIVVSSGDHVIHQLNDIFR
ncbi:Trk system potassium transporter TrkA [Bengtsoniella intestinalis]|uniref:Trk system potassium transporter TrkA n=1 Tax=Bengtsoniella intestinalis TaxID=3073143 RepID=UPI00391F9A2A